MMDTSLAVRRVASVFALALLVAGCASNDAQEPATENDASSALPADHPPLTSPAQGAAGAMSGIVLEQIDGGGYTYARLQTDVGEIWTAGPITTLSEGERVGLVDPFPMSNFRSNALDRTFEMLYFVGGYQSGAVAPAPSAAGGAVLQVLNSGGYTYLEVQTDGGVAWLAAPGVQVAEGDQVLWRDGMVMQGFTSSTLNRTFDEILFVGGVEVVK